MMNDENKLTDKSKYGNSTLTFERESCLIVNFMTREKTTATNSSISRAGISDLLLFQ